MDIVTVNSGDSMKKLCFLMMLISSFASIFGCGGKVDFAPTPDAPLTDAGYVANCSGYNGSPSCHIIQIPQTTSGSTSVATCPTDYKLIGCGFLCDNGNKPGGTEMLSDSSCRAQCQNAAVSKATAFCYRGDQSQIQRVVVNNVPRDTEVSCPSSHPQLLGCTSRCVNSNTINNPGGITLNSGKNGCGARCDYPGDVSPQLVAYCGNFSKSYAQAIENAKPNGATSTCPAGTTMTSGFGMCTNGRTGGFIAAGSRQYQGLCAANPNENIYVSELAVFCLGD